MDKKLEARKDKRAAQLRTLLLTESSDAKGAALDQTKAQIDKYIREYEFWSQIEDEEELEGATSFLRIDNWGEQHFGGHGLMFIGAFCNGSKPLFPVMLLCDEQGQYVNFSEEEIMPALQEVDDFDIHYFKPTEQENTVMNDVYGRLLDEMQQKYIQQTGPIMEYNRRKVENWIEIRTDQLNLQMEELQEEITALNIESALAKEFLEKLDIKKKADEKKKQLLKLQEAFHAKVSQIQKEGEEEIAKFNKQYDIMPILVIKVVLKY